MVRDAVASCGAVLWDLKRVATSPEDATMYIRSSHIENIIWIWPGECVEFTSILIFASILTAPQPLLREEVPDLVTVRAFASSHTAAGRLEQVRKESITHFGTRSEHGCYLVRICNVGMCIDELDIFGQRTDFHCFCHGVRGAKHEPLPFLGCFIFFHISVNGFNVG